MNALFAVARRVSVWLVAGLLLLPVAAAAERAKSDRLVVHEWGTFTALQNEQGRALYGINVDDEPVPEFVHNLNPFVLSPAILSTEHWLYRMKGAPRSHPLVSLRLETPVIYFYPPPGAALPAKLNVRVAFRGGWLTEFYPNAEADAPGVRSDRFEFGKLTPETTGRLAWENLQVGTSGTGPTTDEHVWLAPRKTAAAAVTTEAGESEQYLFYRGVGGQNAPLRVTTDREANRLSIYGAFGGALKPNETATLRALWLVHVREGGALAYRAVGPISVAAEESEPVAALPAGFAESSYSRENRARLEEAMHGELVADGLYDDEATAMLSTWQRAYFASPGLRLFYLVPRAWTDHVLPLSLSEPAQIERVMIGRIELITAEQRRLLAELAKMPISDGRWVERIPESNAKHRFLTGRSDFGDLQVKIPADFETYLRLGRFRNALVVAEEAARPTPGLKKFIDLNGLHPYRWKEPAR